MERNGEGAPAASSSSSSSSSSQITRPRRSVDPLLVTCRFFSVITALTAILCIVSNVISAIRSFKNQSDVLTPFPLLLPYCNLWNRLRFSCGCLTFWQIFDGIFRCYAVVITFFVVLAETEWEFIFKNWKVFLRLNPKSSIVLIYDYSMVGAKNWIML